MEATSVQPTIRGIGREAVTAVSEGAGEPEWMREKRLRAWGVFEATPMPRPTDEEWRRTDIRGLKLEAFEVPAQPGGDFHPETSTDHRSGFVQIVDGYVVETELDEDLAARGVVLASLEDAASRYPELVRKYLGSVVPAEYSKFAALAEALGKGVFVYVPKEVQVEFPIQVSSTMTRGGIAVFPRTLVVAEPYSNVTFIEQMYSDDLDQESLSVGVVEAITGEGANVRYVNIQEWGHHVWHFLVEKHQIERDSQENSLNIGLGGKFAKSNVETALVGQGASCEMLGLYFCDEEQRYDYHTLQDHVAPHCFSDLLYKGVLRDRARAVFSGLIKVRPGSQKTDAYQTNRNLLLSDNARADSIPNLEIEANDVKCSHGASVGPVDPDQLFYLMARGLSKQDATRMIVDGFFEPLTSRIPLEGVREKLQAAIDQKME